MFKIFFEILRFCAGFPTYYCKTLRHAIISNSLSHTIIFMLPNITSRTGHKQVSIIFPNETVNPDFWSFYHDAATKISKPEKTDRIGRANELQIKTVPCRR